MKGYLLLISVFMAVILAGCTKKSTESYVTATTPSQLIQTIYADRMWSDIPIEFATKGPWVSSVIDSTKASASADWISITPASGELAGDYTVNLILKKNFTGKKRTAVVNIHCGSDKISLIITQLATTAAGITPEMKKLSTVWRPGSGFIYRYRYDSQGRLSEERISDPNDSETVYTYTYPSATLIERSSGGSILNSYTLDNNGNITRSVSIDNENIYSYSEGYLSGILPSATDDLNLKTDYTWEQGNLVSVVFSDNNSGSLYTKTFTHSTARNNMSNIDLNCALTSGDGIFMFDRVGHRSRYLPSKVTRLDADGSPAQIATYRYVQDEEGYVTKVFQTLDGEDASDEPQLVLTYQ